MKSVFCSFFGAVYGTVFSVIIAILLFAENISYPCKKEFLLSNGIIFSVVIIILLMGIGLGYWLKRGNRLLNVCLALDVDKLVLAATVILFLGQCYVFYNIFFISGWDTRVIRDFVSILMDNGDKSGVNAYYSRYPNNLAMSYFFLFLQNLNNQYGIFNGVYSYMCVVVLNCAINSVSCWLSYKTAKIFVSPMFAVSAFVLCVLSVGISGWSVICYSDALALFFPILSVFLYCKEYKRIWAKRIGFLASGFVSAVGYFVKPQCLFVLIAIVILEILKLAGKFSFKTVLRQIAVCLVAVTVFGITNISLNSLNKKYDLVINNEKSFGFAHFLMLGANEEKSGVYSEDDVSFSNSFSTSKERSKANLKVFKERVSNMKGNVFTHLMKKMLVSFNDGTFAWGNEGYFFLSVSENINSKIAPFLKSIYCDGHRFIYFATFQQFVWFFILICSAFSSLSKKALCDRHKLSLIWIVLLGFVLYEVLFEVRARYVYIFVPLLCVLAPLGIRNMSIQMSEILSRIKIKLKG